MLPARHQNRQRISEAVVAKLVVLITQRFGQPDQLATSLYLLLHLQRHTKDTWHQAAFHPIIVDILRGGHDKHGCAAVQIALEVVAVTMRRDALSCGPLVDLGVVTRLAEALQGGVASLSTVWALQALHRLAVSLPTSRDLILATGAVQTLVRQLHLSQECAHYALAKELVWTLISLADDDALCRDAIAASGALPCMVPLLSASPFDATLNGFMGLPALAARGLRVLADTANVRTSVSTPSLPQADSSIDQEEQSLGMWQQDAVPRLLEMLCKAERSAQEASELQSQRILRTTSSTLTQRLRVLQTQLAHLFGAWILSRALLAANAPLADSVPKYSTPGTSDDDEAGDGLLHGGEEELFSSSFLTSRTLNRAIDAAANEALIRVLEAGPSALEPVKEAAGALKVILAGSLVARKAATSGGGFEVVLQLLQDNLNSRLAFDAAELLTILSADSWADNWGHSQPRSNLAVLQQLVAVTRQLLQANDALSESTPHDAAHSSQDGISASVHLCSEARSRELDSVTSDSSQHLLPAAPFSQSVSDPPAKAFARAASLKLQPGLPPIMTRPDGQHSEAAMPKTSHLPSPEPAAPKDPNALASSGSGNRGGPASTSYANQPSDWTRSLSRNQSTSPHQSLDRSRSSGGSWMGGLIKRLSSFKSQDSAANCAVSSPEPTVRFEQHTELPRTSSVSPFGALSGQPLSPAASHTPTAILMPRPATSLNWTPRKPSLPRHPSHSILQAVTTALAKLIAGCPSYQAEAQSLGCLALALDVLTLTGKVGLKAGLMGPVADLIKALCENNALCQQAVGQAGAVGQLLALLQDASCAPLEQRDSTRLPIIGALHAVLEGNKANQLSFQAAGGLDVLMHLLAQASPAPQAPLPPSFSSGIDDHLEAQDITASLDTSLGVGNDQADQTSSESQAMASALVWLMGSAAADAPANQAALQQQGAVQLLIHQLQWGREASLAQGTLWALASLVKGNVDLQNELEAQGGIQLLIAYLHHNTRQAEAAAVALHNGVALHGHNQTAARQGGAFPALLNLLSSGPDSPASQSAARCVHALAQDCLPNQDAACVAGVMVPLLDIIVGGADKLAAKSAALAIAALTSHHTANQDAVRQAGGIGPLVQLVRAGPLNPAAVCAAAALANLAANNGINQQTVADCGGLEAVVDLLKATSTQPNTSRACIEALKALAAATDSNLASQERAALAGAPQPLCHLAVLHSLTDFELAWQVCKALACLTHQCPAAQQACSPALPAVTALLSQPNPAVAGQACQALAFLVADCPHHQAAAAEAGAVDTLMHLLLAVATEGSASEVQQGRQGVIHVAMAILLLTGQGSVQDARQLPYGGLEIQPASHLPQASPASSSHSVPTDFMSPEQKLSFALSFQPSLLAAGTVTALLHLLHGQQTYRLQAARTLRYQAAEWQVQLFTAEFSERVAANLSLANGLQSLSDIGVLN